MSEFFDQHGIIIPVFAAAATFLFTLATLRTMRSRERAAREGTTRKAGFCLCCGPNVTPDGECLCTAGACGISHTKGQWL